jgi:uncharacterized protein with HEPN domain
MEIDFLQKNCAHVEIESLLRDEVLRRACLKSLEIICEASKSISEGMKKTHPDVDWRRITGKRAKLVHRYFDVDWEIIEDVINNDLPGLRSNVLRLLSETYWDRMAERP